MAYSKKQIESAKELILDNLSQGKSLKNILDNSKKTPSRATVYQWLNEEHNDFDTEMEILVDDLEEKKLRLLEVEVEIEQGGRVIEETQEAIETLGSKLIGLFVEESQMKQDKDKFARELQTIILNLNTSKSEKRDVVVERTEKLLSLEKLITRAEGELDSAKVKCDEVNNEIRIQSHTLSIKNKDLEIYEGRIRRHYNDMGKDIRI